MIQFQMMTQPHHCNVQAGYTRTIIDDDDNELYDVWKCFQCEQEIGIQWLT